MTRIQDLQRVLKRYATEHGLGFDHAWLGKYLGSDVVGDAIRQLFRVWDFQAEQEADSARNTRWELEEQVNDLRHQVDQLQDALRKANRL